jgi:hypothetical protein
LLAFDKGNLLSQDFNYIKMEKYEELYNLSKEVLKEEEARFNRIDEKASKYFPVLTLMAGASGFFGKWMIDNLIPPETTLGWFLVTTGVLLFLSVFVSWSLIFSVFRMHQVEKIPLNSEMIEFFNNNELLDIYYALTRGNKSALENNRKTTDRKSKILSHGYRAMIISGLLLILFLSLFVIHRWNKPMVIKKTEGRLIMSVKENENPTSQDVEKPSTKKPNPNVVPPTYDVVTEGYDPSKIEKRGDDKKK